MRVSPPFAPSWLDHFEDWIEGLPVPPWASYLVAAVGASVLLHIPRWLDGSLRLASFEVYQFSGAISLVYFFAFIHYLNATARRALANYRPLLDLNDGEYASTEYTLARTPRRLGALAILIGVPTGAASFFLFPDSWGVQASFSIFSAGLILAVAVVVQVAITHWIIQVIRQARTIDRIHALTKSLNLYRRDPVYSFSYLTLRSALGMLLGVYAYLFVSLYLGLAPLPTAIDVLTLGFAIPLSLAIFFLPLSRMHGRLATEKARQLLELDDRYTRLVERFNRQVDQGKFADLDATARAIASLTTQRESLAKISTWPWRPETLRSLLSTVALPVLLYLASRLIGRLFGV